MSATGDAGGVRPASVEAELSPREAVEAALFFESQDAGTSHAKWARETYSANGNPVSHPDFLNAAAKCESPSRSCEHVLLS